MAKKTTLTFPFIVSATLHIGVIAGVIYYGDLFDKPKPAALPQPSAPAVKAVVIEKQQIDDYVKQLQEQKRAENKKEMERQQELERQALAAKKAREQEQQRLKQLEAQKQQKEQELQKAAEAAKAAKLKQQQEKEKAAKAEAAAKAAEEKRIAQEKAQKAAEEKARLEAEKKAKAEAERKAKEEAKRLQEQELADALAAEQAAVSAARNRQLQTEVGRYRAMITSTIQRNLVVNESMRGQLCKIKVRLASDGFVTNTQIIEGDPTVCRAAKAAINKAGRLPVSSEPDVYQLMKEINLEVRPEFN